MVQVDCSAVDALAFVEEAEATEEAVAAVARFLAHGDESVRNAAAVKLVSLGDPGASQAAHVSALLMHGDPAIREVSLDVLAELHEFYPSSCPLSQYADRVASLLCDPEDHLRAEAAKVMPLMGFSAFGHVDALVDLLSDRDASTRAAAVTAISEIGAVGQANAVASLACDADWEVRGAVAKALALIGRGSAQLQTLADLLGDPVPNVGKKAAISLAALGGAGRLRPRGDLQDEINIHVAWASLLDSTPPTPIVTQVGDHEVWVVENLFSRRECAALLAASESHGYGKTGYPQDYRGNLRLIATDAGLSRALFERLRPHVPQQFHHRGAWDVCGLNECFRLSKYHPKTRFEAHVDACFQRTYDEMSMITVNAYLNDGFEGGSTRFYLKRDEDEPDLVVVPKAGSCVLFSQPQRKHYLHDGEEVVSGFKYLLRSDVMYRRRS